MFADLTWNLGRSFYGFDRRLSLLGHTFFSKKAMMLLINEGRRRVSRSSIRCTVDPAIYSLLEVHSYSE